MEHVSLVELEAGMDFVHRSPHDKGTLEMIVQRPQENAREVCDAGELSLDDGLVGDNWKPRGSKAMPDSSAHPDRQITIMNSRLIGLLARDRKYWPLAGDQLYVDLDLSAGNLPPGTRLSIGSAVIEVTASPHTGCSKFSARFGAEALRFISVPERKELHLRGIYAKVVQPGVIRVGDLVRKN